MKENKFQSDLRKEIESILPGCMVLKNDPTYIRGVPDLTILYKNKWAMLECKKDGNAGVQPCQEHYVKWANDNSFARFICPENKEEVLDELQQALRPRRKTRIPRSE